MEWIKERFDRLIAPAGYVALIAIAGFFIIGAMVQEKTVWGQVAAAWIQAIGSAGAIWAVIWIERRKAAADLQARRDVENDIVRSAWLLVSQMRDAVQAGAAAVTSGEHDPSRYLERVNLIEARSYAIKIMLRQSLPAGLAVELALARKAAKPAIQALSGWSTTALSPDRALINSVVALGSAATTINSMFSTDFADQAD